MIQPGFIANAIRVNKIKSFGCCLVVISAQWQGDEIHTLTTPRMAATNTLHDKNQSRHTAMPNNRLFGISRTSRIISTPRRHHWAYMTTIEVNKKQ